MAYLQKQGLQGIIYLDDLVIMHQSREPGGVDFGFYHQQRKITAEPFSTDTVLGIPSGLQEN